MEIGVKQEEFLRDEYPVKKEESLDTIKAENIPKETVQFVIKEIRERKHKCPLCEKACYTIYNLRDHMVTHSKDKSFQCSQCSKLFGNQRRLDNHLKTHSDESLPCNLCKKTFKSATHLRNHLQRHSGEKKHECDICGKKFSDSSHKRRHILQIHEGKKPDENSKVKIPCEQCGKILWTKFSYERHLLVKHSSSREMKCPECPKTFKLKYNLKEHMLVHKQEKPFACDICKMRFKRKSNLLTHSANHDSQTKQCQYCEKTYRNRESLKGHLRNHHRGLPANVQDINKAVSCTVCTKDFKNLEALKEHAKMHIKDRYKQQLYTCPHCGKVLQYKHNYQRHLVVHKQETPFECATCSKKFKRRDELIKHLRIHSKNRPVFPCKICGAKLMHKKTLREHDLKHNANNGRIDRIYNTRHRNKSPDDAVRIKTEADEPQNQLQTEIEISGTIITEPNSSIVIKPEEN